MRISRPDSLKFHTAGKGDPLLLLHGFGISPFSYKNVIDSLSRSHQVIMPDYSLAWNSRHEIEGLVRTIKRRLNELEINGRVTVVGHSLGGMIGALFSANYPEAVKNLVIVDGLAFPIRRNRWIHAAITLRECVLNFLEPNGAKVMGRVALDFFQRMRLDILTLHRQWACLLRMDIEESLQLIKCPVTVIWGEKDDLIPVSHGQRLHRRIKQSLFYKIKNADHSWILFNPGVLEEFLRLSPAKTLAIG